MAIKAAGNFLPGTVDTPLDARSRAATKADILKIENPCLGGIVYCLEDGKYYKITGLKPKLVGSLTVQNAAVDTYEEFASAQDQDAPTDGQQYARQNGGWAVVNHPEPPKPEEDAPTDGQQYARQNGGWAVVNHPEPPKPEDAPSDGKQYARQNGHWTIVEHPEPSISDAPSLTTWQLIKPADGVHLLVKRAGADGTRANAVTIIDTSSNAADRAKVSAYMDAGVDGFWTTCPADGFSSPYDDAPVAVDLSGVEQPAILYYCWLNDAGVAGDWHSQRFPAAGGAGAAGKDGNPGQDGKDGTGQYIACLCQKAPPGVFDGLIWVKGGNDTPQYITGSSSPAVAVDEVVDPATAPDFTIVIKTQQQEA